MAWFLVGDCTACRWVVVFEPRCFPPWLPDYLRLHQRSDVLAGLITFVPFLRNNSIAANTAAEGSRP